MICSWLWVKTHFRYSFFWDCYPSIVVIVVVCTKLAKIVLPDTGSFDSHVQLFSHVAFPGSSFFWWFVARP